MFAKYEFVCCFIMVEDMSNDETALDKEIQCIVQRRLANTELSPFYFIAKSFHIETAVYTANLFQYGKTFKRPTFLIIIKILKKYTFHIIVVFNMFLSHFVTIYSTH